MSIKFDCLTAQLQLHIHPVCFKSSLSRWVSRLKFIDCFVSLLLVFTAFCVCLLFSSSANLLLIWFIRLWFVSLPCVVAFASRPISQLLCFSQSKRVDFLSCVRFRANAAPVQAIRHGTDSQTVVGLVLRAHQFVSLFNLFGLFLLLQPDEVV